MFPNIPRNKVAHILPVVRVRTEENASAVPESVEAYERHPEGGLGTENEVLEREEGASGASVSTYDGSMDRVEDQLEALPMSTPENQISEEDSVPVQSSSSSPKEFRPCAHRLNRKRASARAYLGRAGSSKMVHFESSDTSESEAWNSLKRLKLDSASCGRSRKRIHRDTFDSSLAASVEEVTKSVGNEGNLLRSRVNERPNELGYDGAEESNNEDGNNVEIMSYPASLISSSQSSDDELQSPKSHVGYKRRYGDDSPHPTHPEAYKYSNNFGRVVRQSDTEVDDVYDIPEEVPGPSRCCNVVVGNLNCSDSDSEHSSLAVLVDSDETDIESGNHKVTMTISIDNRGMDCENYDIAPELPYDLDDRIAAAAVYEADPLENEEDSSDGEAEADHHQIDADLYVVGYEEFSDDTDYEYEQAIDEMDMYPDEVQAVPPGPVNIENSNSVDSGNEDFEALDSD